MYCNASAVLHSGDNTYEFPYVYKYEKTLSDINTNGLIIKKAVVLFIPQNRNTVNLMDLNVTVGKDYFFINNGSKKYTIQSFTDAMYGSDDMKHMEFILI